MTSLVGGPLQALHGCVIASDACTLAQSGLVVISCVRMSAPNPLHLANTAQQMARNAPASDAVVFNKVAMVCMGVMAAASVMQVLQPLLRDLNRKHAADEPRKRVGRGR